MERDLVGQIIWTDPAPSSIPVVYRAKSGSLMFKASTVSRESSFCLFKKKKKLTKRMKIKVREAQEAQDGKAAGEHPNSNGRELCVPA